MHSHALSFPRFSCLMVLHARGIWPEKNFESCHPWMICDYSCPTGQKESPALRRTPPQEFSTWDELLSC